MHSHCPLKSRHIIDRPSSITLNILGDFSYIECLFEPAGIVQNKSEVYRRPIYQDQEKKKRLGTAANIYL